MSDPTGPSDETLASLAAMMGSMAEGMASGQIGNIALRPKGKVCAACGKSFGRPLKIGGQIQTDACKECRALLKGGHTIFVTLSGRMATVKQKKGSDSMVHPSFQGRIVRVTDEWIEKLISCGQIKENR